MWCFGDGPHPFWYCLFAAHVWTPWIDHFWPLFDYLIDWRSVLRFHVELNPAAQRAYDYSLFAVFHIVRTVIFRGLWIHRNDIRFNDAATNLLGIQAQIHVVDKLIRSGFHTLG